MLASSLASPRTRAGAIVRVDGVLHFLPNDVVRKFVVPPTISDVSGTGLTMALVDGQVLTVISAGMRGAALSVCEVGGELIGVLGAHPEDVGFYELDGAGVRYAGQPAPLLDVAELVRSSALAAIESAEPEA